MIEVVLDSNILFRILISEGNILNLLFNNNLRLFAPEKLEEEFLNNKDEILEKSKLSELEFDELVSIIFNIINWVSLEEYKDCISEARALLGEHQKDEDFIALCLAKGIKLWTYESLLFNLGFGISTKEISEIISRYF